MATATMNDCTQLDTTMLERVNYFPRQLLTADDMTADQQYFLDKLRRHNRYLHGWGVVCGLEVSVAPTAASPWQVQIGPGYALGPYGDEIFVPGPVLLDLAQCGPGASTDPCDPGSLLQGGTAKNGSILYLAIRYEECFAKPVRVMPGGCGCTDSTCEPSRIDDSYEIECLADLPPSSQPTPQGPSMCDILSGQALSQCPPCPTDPWVVLAQVRLPAQTGTALAQTGIDNVSVRRKLFSTAMIQEQVRLCCCSGTDKAPARVTSINPAAGTVFTDASTIPPALVITFDKHLVAASVSTTTILVNRTSAAGGPSKQVQGAVTYDDGLRSAQFTPAEAFTIPGTYFVTVVGTGPASSFIVDSDNLALDGNDDAIAGGNFISQFTVLTPQTTPTPTPTPTVTPTPSPLTAVVTSPNPVASVKRTNPSVVGDLRVTIAGGVAGQKIQGDITVTLSQNIGKTAANDTAQWSDSAGNTVAAKKGTGANANVYTFANVTIPQPGPGQTATVKIANMKIDASKIVPGNTAQDITAFLAISSAPAVAVSGVPQVVGTVPHG
jgi:hypothetical protein